MDPLSAIASVAGIATAAGEVAKILGPYLSASSDVPKIAAQLHSESLATETILSALYKLAGSFSTDNARYASLIQVDQLMAVLTDGVLIFSEMHTMMLTLPPPEPANSGERFWSQMQWVRKKSSLTASFTRLQAFKISVNCILSILQSDSQTRAENSQQKLLEAVEMILEGNADLSKRLMGMETAFSAISQRQSQIHVRASIDSTVSENPARRRSSLFEFAFEQDLKSSRVYRRAKKDRNSMDFSMRSSVARGHSWSIFSGISLSNISEISVLALPLYAEDISNPHNYDFGPGVPKQQPLPAPVKLTKSIYHECVELQLQLSQFDWFAELYRRAETPSEDESPLKILISIFQSGTPFFLLFVELDDSQQDRWQNLMDSSPINVVARLAVVEFVQTCVNRLGFQPSNCFTVSDLMKDDSTNHIKVIRLLQVFVGRLIKAGVIQPVSFEPNPRSFTAESDPAELTVDDFLHAERLYLKCLESLLETSEQIKSVDVLPVDTLEQIFAPISQLVDAQRKFLIRVEMLAPKECWRQTWTLAFAEWSQRSSSCYAALVARETESKATVRTAASLTESHHVGRRELLGDALAGLSLPSQRLDKYESFLLELSLHGHHQSEDIESAMMALRSVKASVDAAIRNNELQKAGKALLERLDLENRVAVEALGDLLLFDYVDTTVTGFSAKSQLLLYEKGVVQATEAGLKALGRGILRPKRPLTQDRPEIQIIHGKSIRIIDRSSKHPSRGCSIWWWNSGTESHLEFFHSSPPRIQRWEKDLREMRSQTQAQALATLPGYSPEYKLVVMAEDGSGSKNLIAQFIGPQFVDISDLNLETSHCRECLIDNEVTSLKVFSAADHQDEFSHMRVLREQSLGAGDGYLLVYSVTSRYSFERITDLWQQILRLKDKDSFPVVLVGNDCSRDSEREVTKQEGHRLARELRCEFIEADAEAGINVDKAFYEVVREIKRYKWGGKSYDRLV